MALSVRLYRNSGVKEYPFWGGCRSLVKRTKIAVWISETFPIYILNLCNVSACHPLLLMRKLIILETRTQTVIRSLQTW